MVNEEDMERREFLKWMKIGAGVLVFGGIVKIGEWIYKMDRTTKGVADKVNVVTGEVTGKNYYLTHINVGKVPVFISHYNVNVNYQGQNFRFDDKKLYDATEKGSKVSLRLREKYSVRRDYKGNFIDSVFTGFESEGLPRVF